MNITVPILTIDVPTLNGRTYTAEVAETIIDKVNSTSHGVLGMMGVPPRLTVDLLQVSHRVSNARIADGQVIVDVHVLETPHGKALNALLEAYGSKIPDGVGFRCAGTGELSSEGEVSNYHLISIDFVYDPA